MKENFKINFKLKKLAAIILALAIVITLMPVGARAAQNDTTATSTTTSATTTTSLTNEKIQTELLTGMKAVQKGTKLTIKWGAVDGAKGYLIYASYLGDSYGKAVATVSASKTRSVTLTKLNKKAVKTNKNYQVAIQAYKVVNGKKVKLGSKATMYVAGTGSSKYTNPKSISVLSDTKLTLTEGDTSLIKAKVYLTNSSKKLLPSKYATKLRYISSDKSVASVDSNGQITAVSPGTCKIRVYTINGYGKNISLTVENESVYAQADNWAYYQNTVTDKRADVFLVAPTFYSGADENDLYWSEYTDDTKTQFVNAIKMEIGIYDDDARVFAPYYHQASFKAYYASQEKQDQVFGNAYAEIKDAFAYYMKHENNGRPLILAGFSQGAEMCIRLLKDYCNDETFNDQLVACYAIGWRFTQEEQDAYPNIKYASGQTDTGVLITFDCESEDITDTVIVPSGTKTLCINPLNWKTDSTYADKSLNLGTVIMRSNGEFKKEIANFTGCYIDPTRGTLKVPDVNKDDYPARVFDTNGIFHIYDFEFFYRNLEKNVQDRLEAFLGQVN